MSQQRSPHEDFIMAFIVVFLTFGVCYFIWYFFSVELTNFVRWVRVAELYIVKLIYGTGSASTSQNVDSWLGWLSSTDAHKITTDHIRVSTKVAVTPLRDVFLVVMAAMIIIIFFKGPSTKFRRRMRLEELMKEQSKSFPANMPFLKFDPSKLPYRVPGQPVPKNLPLFSEALAPEEWLAHNEICSTKSPSINDEKAYHALVKQLGNRWQGPEALPIHVQGLFAAFALKHVRRRKDCETLLNQLAVSWSADKGFTPSMALRRQISKIIKDPKLGGALRKHSDKHAFETTALLRALSRAREEGGVLAPAEFLWLRGVDRNLWYPLNNLGRKAYHAEAAGALVHYTNELIAGQKIPTPRFEEVIKSLKTYMKSVSARAIPELDTSPPPVQKKKLWG